MNVSWDASPDSSVATYNVYYGTSPRSYSGQVPAGANLTAGLSGLADATTYYFAVTAVNAAGIEGDYSAEASYLTPGNQAPTISTIPDQSIQANQSTAAIAFTVGDAETPAASLTVTAVSSATTIVPNGNIILGGSGANRTVTVTPAAGKSGSAIITVTVSDGAKTATSTFTVNVQSSGNTPPTISGIGAQSGTMNQAIGPISFTIGDAQVAASSLTVSGTSSATTIVPNANITFSGSGANRTVTVTPAAGKTGSAQITLTVSDGTLTATTSFTVTVQAPANTPPTISGIGAQMVTSGQVLGPIAFTVGDAETAVGSLTVSGSSSSTTLVPNANITFSGSGASRTVTVTPAAGKTGSAQITLTVNDGSLTATTSFAVTVQAIPNTPPTISGIGAQSVTSGQVLGPIAFTVGDAETAAGSLSVSGFSSATALVPNANIVYGGSGANRTVTITPALGKTGTTQITLTVNDGNTTSSTSFALTVQAIPNTPPTISGIGAQTTASGQDLGPLALTVGDAETAAGSLTLSGSSSSTALVPNANIVFGGSGSDRTVTISPAAGKSGTAQITLTVNDGTTTTSTSFALTVQPPAPNTAPTISTIATQTISVGQGTGPLAFLIGDGETPAANLTVSGSSSSTTLVPNANILFAGSGANRLVSIIPAPGKLGTAQITISVSDGTNRVSSSFTLNVQVAPTNTAPTISTIPSQTVPVNQSTAPIPFTVSDTQTAPDGLSYGAVSSATALVPNENIVLGGSGANRTVTITPAPDQFGTAQIRVLVSDGTNTASTTFTLTVQLPVTNSPPTISAIADQAGYVDNAVGPVAFTINDANTPATGLMLSAVSSSQSLVPDSSIALGGSGANRTVTMTPAAGQTGAATITITVSDGTNSAQSSFAVSVTQPTVMTKASLPSTSTYNGLFYENDAARLTSAGSFKVTVSQSGKYSGTLQMAAGKYAFSGQFGFLCQGTNIVIRKGATSLSLNFSLNPHGSPNPFAGSLTDGGWVSQMHGVAAPYNSKTNPAPYLGTYTMAVPSGDIAPTVAVGNGYGSIKVDASGTVKLSGVLADGSKITAATQVSDDGSFPLFVPLYAGKGMVMAWINFANRTNDDLHGTINWVKQADLLSKYYPAGFAVQGNAVGALFPPQSALVLSAKVARLQSTGAGKGVVSAISVSPSTGLFKGSLLDEATGKPSSFQGALLLKPDIGYGFILGTSQSMPVVLAQ